MGEGPRANQPTAMQRRRGGGGGRQQGRGLGRAPAPAGFLARMGGVEDGDGGAVLGQVVGEQRAGGAGADDRDLHASASTAASSSSGVAAAVPSLPTTTPAA